MLPVGEVGEGDDALRGDPQHLVEHGVRATQYLQCLGHDHQIAGIVDEVAQAVVEILFEHADALAQTGGDAVGIDLQPIAGDVLVACQRRQQRAVTAPQIENMSVAGNPVVDQLKIRTHQAVSPVMSAWMRRM